MWIVVCVWMEKFIWLHVFSLFVGIDLSDLIILPKFEWQLQLTLTMLNVANFLRFETWFGFYWCGVKCISHKIFFVFFIRWDLFICKVFNCIWIVLVWPWLRIWYASYRPHPETRVRLNACKNGLENFEIILRPNLL